MIINNGSDSHPSCVFRGNIFPNPFQVCVQDSMRGLAMVNHSMDGEFLVIDYVKNVDSEIRSVRDGFVTIKHTGKTLDLTLYPPLPDHLARLLY
jgi:hypothetical protein